MFEAAKMAILEIVNSGWRGHLSFLGLLFIYYNHRKLLDDDTDELPRVSASQLAHFSEVRVHDYAQISNGGWVNLEVGTFIRRLPPNLLVGLHNIFGFKGHRGWLVRLSLVHGHGLKFVLVVVLGNSS